jgi:hypothetical protein
MHRKKIKTHNRKTLKEHCIDTFQNIQKYIIERYMCAK